MYKKIKYCRVCANRKFSKIIDLGNQPLANSLTKKPVNQKKIPLEIIRCNKCSLIQLTATVNPKKLFTNYLWVTGTSEEVKKYRNYFVSKLNKDFKNKKKKILEIASNDGFFLKKFKNNGHKVLGVDPARNIAYKASKSGIKTIPEFFNENTHLKIKKHHFIPNIIICRNVIPHVENIKNIIKGIYNLISDDGTIYIEFHYAENLSKNLHYDYIYHEHIFYYSFKSINYLLKKFNLFAYDYFESPISGGSIVLKIKKEKIKISTKLKKLINYEKKIGINTSKYWSNFKSKCIRHKTKLVSIIKKLNVSKIKIYGYGASARSSTLINYCNFSNKNFHGIFDKNPLKRNLYTAGSKIKILPVTNKLIKKADCIVIFAWNFEKEIMKYLKSIKFKKKIISVLPRITIN